MTPVWGARRNGQLVRFVAAHLLAVVAEWALFIVLLVHVHEREGATALGIASIALLAPYVLVSPWSGHLAVRRRPGRVRLAGLAGQTAGYGIAAAAAYRDAPTWVAVAGGVLAVASVTTLRPAGAVLLPAVVRSSRQLTTANLWVGHAESASVLLGPILATALLAADGARLGLAGCAAVSAVALAVATAAADVDPPAIADAGGAGAITHSRAALRTVAARPGATGVLVVAASQFVLLGALDLVVVVSAEDVLDLGDAGPGLLSTLLGVGAVLSMAANAVIVRRRRLAPALVTSLGLIALASIVFGASISLAVAVVTLPLLGATQAVLELMSRMLLQRSAPPNDLGAVFALLEIGSGLGLLVGSLVAQVLIAVSGVGTAMIGIGVVTAVVLLGTRSSLRRADDGADVPVVAMSLLRRDPVFSPLPPLALEAVARSAREIAVEPGSVVISEGDDGDGYYVVADGRFDVSMGGGHVRSLERGCGFGEIALLADVPRTATVTCSERGGLLEIDRTSFLVALTGHDASRQAAWGAVRSMELGPFAGTVRGAEPPDLTTG